MYDLKFDTISGHLRQVPEKSARFNCLKFYKIFKYNLAQN